MTRKALLALADGAVFAGESIGAAGVAVGEVVFNTAMSGYQEILTDPSYAMQIITMTSVHIGNVGVNALDAESSRIHASGLVVRDAPASWSNWRGAQSLSDYLAAHGKVAIAGIDTRQLTRKLRIEGSQAGCIVASAAADRLDAAEAIAKARAFCGMVNRDLAQVVTTPASYRWSEGSWDGYVGFAAPKNAGADLGAGSDTGVAPDSGTASLRVVAYDFGIKRNILRMLVERGCEVTVVPAATTAEQTLALAPDGVFLSNGPGDPQACGYAVAAIQGLLRPHLPVFGICLGYQLLALACGARTVKMKFGHHGANHPVQDLNQQKVFITSQNHGFAVEEESLPASLRATHRSLFDRSLQGVRHTQYPAFGFQGHPEASPGPHDLAALFDRFVEDIRVCAARNA